MKPMILFIHGAFMTPKSFDNFNDYFQARGYQTMAPAWPGHDASVSAQRQETSPQIKNLGIAELVAYYQAIIEKLPEKPILIGHSFGGLIVQLLMDRNLGQAGIALDPGAPKGVISAKYPSTFKSVWKILLRPWLKIARLSQADFNYSFVHTLPRDEQAAIYEAYVVPETSKIFFQAGLSFLIPHSTVQVDYANNKRGKLLLVSGGDDHIAPPKMVQRNYDLYISHGNVQTDVRHFPKRTHWLMNQEGWEEIADTIDNWLQASK